MFTGIIESTGKVREISQSGANRLFWIVSDISHSLKIDQSICHDGVCLTIDQLGEGAHRVTAIAETLSKTNLGTWKAGQTVNLERSMELNGRLDGHIVQGHGDAVATCLRRRSAKGSWVYQFEIDKKFSHLIIEKGSICLNGISLTIFDVKKKTFQVAIIPYTYEHTNISAVKKGSRVNVEFDIIGKYIARIAGKSLH